jgi:hypothetical protein
LKHYLLESIDPARPVVKLRDALPQKFRNPPNVLSRMGQPVAAPQFIR